MNALTTYSRVTMLTVGLMLVTGGCGQMRADRGPESAPARLSAAEERQVVEATRKINQAFVRGDLETLASFIRDDFTMIHGHMKRIEDKGQAVAEWRGLFSKRGATGIAYYIRETDFKVQSYDNVAIVTFSYEHPRLEGGRLSSEAGKAVYVFLREGGQWRMVHCATLPNLVGHGVGMP